MDTPLADRLRPQTLDDISGQHHRISTRLPLRCAYSAAVFLICRRQAKAQGFACPDNFVGQVAGGAVDLQFYGTYHDESICLVPCGTGDPLSGILPDVPLPPDTYTSPKRPPGSGVSRPSPRLRPFPARRHHWHCRKKTPRAACYTAFQRTGGTP